MDPINKKAFYGVYPVSGNGHYQASITGDRRTLIADAAIPATMAVIYLALLIYFKMIGGYKAVHIEKTRAA